MYFPLFCLIALISGTVNVWYTLYIGDTAKSPMKQRCPAGTDIDDFRRLVKSSGDWGALLRDVAVPDFQARFLPLPLTISALNVYESIFCLYFFFLLAMCRCTLPAQLQRPEMK